MPRYEYKVVPAPTKGLKGKGVRGAEARFSNAIQELMNGLAGYGWEYQRAETLPSVERSGLTGSTTEWRNVLVFRRLKTTDAEDFMPELLPAPDTPSAAPQVASDAQDSQSAKLPEDATPPPDGSSPSSFDNGVEDTGSESRIGASLSILARARKLASPGAAQSDGKSTPDDTPTQDKS